MLRRVLTLNFLDSFVFGVTTLAIPLLMLERGIDLASIGIVFSLAPIAKLLVRLSSAALADAAGERWFYLLNGLANFSQSVAYIVSSSPFGFALGKAVDGARESFIWAVNRSSIMHQAPERAHFATASMVSGRALYFAFGSLSVGLLFNLGGYSSALVLCAAIGMAMAALSLQVKNTPHREKPSLSDFSLLGRGRRFYETAGALAVGSSFYMVIIYFLMPVFFKLSGFGEWEIGLIYAAYFLVFGSVMNFLSHHKVSSRTSAAVGALLFMVPLVGMAFLGNAFAPFLFLLMAVGDAHLGINWEEIIYLQASGAKKRSTEVALLHVPSSFAVFFLSAVSGFVASAYGFAPLFLFGAASLALFALWSVRLSGMK